MSEVDDDDLFAYLEDRPVPRSTYVDEESKRKPTAYGACPRCLNDKVGLVIQGGHLVYKDHTVRTWGSAVRQCIAGGQRLCEEPARDVASHTGLQTPTCICN